MEIVTVSKDFRVVLPKKVRDALGLVPGQRLMVVAQGDRIEFVVVPRVAEMKGIMKGIDSVVERDDDRL